MPTPNTSLTVSKQLLLITILLTLVGIAVVFEASATEAFAKFNDQYYFIKQQLKWLVLGYIGLFLCMHLPLQWLKKVAPITYIIGIVCLIAVLIPQFGVSVKGATRWLSIGGFRFQPVEIMKVGIIAYFSLWLQRHQKLIPFLSLTLLPVVLVMAQPDLGSTLILLSIAFGLYVVAGGELKTIGFIGTIGIGLIGLLIISSPYRMERVRTYLDPSADPLDTGYHIRQITLALGNGGWFGTGLGQSRQKYQYIPEVSTDSIFAIVAEETGFVGSLLLIGTLMYFILLCFRIVALQPDRSFEQFIATGASIWIAAHIIINLASIVALVPLTGIPLPFISRGGTSLVTLLCTTGILIHLAKNQEVL